MNEVNKDLESGSVPVTVTVWAPTLEIVNGLQAKVLVLGVVKVTGLGGVDEYVKVDPVHTVVEKSVNV